MNNKNIRYLKKFSLLLLTIGVSVFYQPNAFAQNDRDFSTAQDVAIALYKTANKVPNLQKWVEETEPYKTTPLAKRANVMEKELGKLQLSYQEFLPQKDFLLLRTFVSLKTEKIESLPTEENLEEPLEPTYKMDIGFLKAPDAVYFPYDFIGQRIAVMPYELKKLMSPEISKEEFAFLQNKITSKNLMVVRLKARESDLSLPHKIDGIHQWVLKTEIASMEIWNKTGVLLWEYTAPWYITPTVLELKDLYEVGRGQDQ